jgi:hypothetical protein
MRKDARYVVGADQIETVASLYRSGQTTAAAELASSGMLAGLDDRGTAECLVLQGMALFDSGDVVGAIDVLGKAIDVAASVSSEAQYHAAFALFVRATDFQTPEEAVSGLTKLRELAARVVDARSLWTASRCRTARGDPRTLLLGATSPTARARTRRTPHE